MEIKPTVVEDAEAIFGLGVGGRSCVDWAWQWERNETEAFPTVGSLDDLRIPSILKCGQDVRTDRGRVAGT